MIWLSQLIGTQGLDPVCDNDFLTFLFSLFLTLVNSIHLLASFFIIPICSEKFYEKSIKDKFNSNFGLFLSFLPYFFL